MKKLIIFSLILACCAVYLRGDTLSAIFALNVVHDLKRVAGGTVTHDKGNFRINQGFINGNATDSAQASFIYSADADITSATAVLIDLNAIADPFGTSANLATVKVMALRNTGETGNIIFGNGATPFAPGMATATTVTIPPMGAYVMAAPYAGFAVATPSYLHISTADDAASYELRIIGTQ